MKNELIELITVIGEQTDPSGFVEAEDTESEEIYAEVKSTVRSDFYESLRNGHKATMVFVVDRDDFALADRTVNDRKKKASRVKYQEVEYRIIREYRMKDNDLELTCEEVE